MNAMNVIESLHLTAGWWGVKQHGVPWADSPTRHGGIVGHRKSFAEAKRLDLK